MPTASRCSCGAGDCPGSDICNSAITRSLRKPDLFLHRAGRGTSASSPARRRPGSPSCHRSRRRSAPRGRLPPGAGRCAACPATGNSSSPSPLPGPRAAPSAASGTRRAWRYWSRTPRRRRAARASASRVPRDFSVSEKLRSPAWSTGATRAARRRRHGRSGPDAPWTGCRGTPFRGDPSPAKRRERGRRVRSGCASLAATRHAPPPTYPVSRLVARASCNLDVKALAATALVLDVRVAELEALVQALARVVELGALEVRQALRVDHHLHAVAVELHVVGIDGVGELELVGHAGAARGAHAQAQRDALAALGEERLHVACRLLGEGNHYLCFFL